MSNNIKGNLPSFNLIEYTEDKYGDRPYVGSPVVEDEEGSFVFGARFPVRDRAEARLYLDLESATVMESGSGATKKAYVTAVAFDRETALSMADFIYAYYYEHEWEDDEEEDPEQS